MLCFFSAVLSLFYLMMVYNPRSNCIKYLFSFLSQFFTRTAKAKNKHEVDSIMEVVGGCVMNSVLACTKISKGIFCQEILYFIKWKQQLAFLGTHQKFNNAIKISSINGKSCALKEVHISFFMCTQRLNVFLYVYHIAVNLVINPVISVLLICVVTF